LGHLHLVTVTSAVFWCWLAEFPFIAAIVAHGGVHAPLAGRAFVEGHHYAASVASAHKLDTDAGSGGNAGDWCWALHLARDIAGRRPCFATVIRMHEERAAGVWSVKAGRD
jgi:hypothetical protein